MCAVIGLSSLFQTHVIKAVFINTLDVTFEILYFLEITLKTIGSIDNRIQTLVFTHSQVISRLLSSDKSFHIANGGISILYIDENNHVHVANYTKHLQTPTGMHTCIF